ncbi:hypothetical protein [Mesorhizobium sophorae]|uniref:hypothetical protein n=1 Tax=Mesorhizobium sophorae TaxID=1300294 RepID=UPI000BA2C2E8|nr:hypothetical protein [Mesorhizobium sophorae]
MRAVLRLVEIGAAVRNGFATAVATGNGGKFVQALSDIIAGLSGVSLASETRPIRLGGLVKPVSPKQKAAAFKRCRKRSGK